MSAHSALQGARSEVVKTTSGFSRHLGFAHVCHKWHSRIRTPLSRTLKIAHWVFEIILRQPYSRVKYVHFILVAAILDLWRMLTSRDTGSCTIEKRDTENMGIAVEILLLCALEFEIWGLKVAGERRKKPLPGQRLTEVKTFQDVLGGYFFGTLCSGYYV